MNTATEETRNQQRKYVTEGDGPGSICPGKKRIQENVRMQSSQPMKDIPREGAPNLTGCFPRLFPVLFPRKHFPAREPCPLSATPLNLTSPTPTPAPLATSS